MNTQFQLEKVEKPNLLLKGSAKMTPESNVIDQFKGLTFNVHTNTNDLEIKSQLILPYELIGLEYFTVKFLIKLTFKYQIFNLSQTKSVTKQTVIQEEESKIYYAPDETDDIDDDDPDEDLNF